MEILVMLPERLLQLREEKKLSQQDFANKLNLTRSTYAHYETGRRSPDYDTLERIASFYDVSVDYLLGRTDNPIVDGNESKNGIDELSKIAKDVGIEQLAFFDESKWKNLTPEDLVEMEKYFQYIVHRAKERKEKGK